MKRVNKDVTSAANRKIEVIHSAWPDCTTWLEAIHQNNMAGRKIVPNHAYNNLFLGKSNGRGRPVPKTIWSALPLYTGTAGVIGAKGKPLGKYVETECKYNGSMKLAIFEANAGQAASIDTLFMCDQGFAPDATPLIQLFNARTGKPIRTENDMLEASSVSVKFYGRVYQAKIKTRWGGDFEKVCNERTSLYIPDSAVQGLVSRDASCYYYHCRRDVGFGVMASIGFRVAVESQEGRAHGIVAKAGG